MDLRPLEGELKAWDRGLYRLSLFVPPQSRADYLVLFHLFAGFIRIIDHPREPMLVPIRLTWWRDWLEALSRQAGYGLPHETLLHDSRLAAHISNILDHVILGWEHDAFAEIGVAFFEAVADLDQSQNRQATSELNVPSKSQSRQWFIDRYSKALGIAESTSPSEKAITDKSDVAAHGRPSRIFRQLMTLSPYGADHLLELFRLMRHSVRP